MDPKDVVTVPEIDQMLIDSHHRASGYFEQEYVDIENLLEEIFLLVEQLVLLGDERVGFGEHEGTVPV